MTVPVAWGRRIAPTAPCTSRAAISIAGLTETPQITKAAVNPMAPRGNMRRRP